MDPTLALLSHITLWEFSESDSAHSLIKNALGKFSGACFPGAQSIRASHPPSMRARPASPNGGSCNNFARITTLIHEYAPFITLFLWSCKAVPID